MAFTCPKCSTEFFDRLKYCPECGFDFTAALKRCPKCRHHVPVDSRTCPECGLDFEKFSFIVPKVVVFGSLAVIIIFAAFFPWIWKVSPWMHDKGVISDGYVMTDVGGFPMVPMFIHWKSGERYIEKSKKLGGLSRDTSYMNELLPLPPEVVFHFDIPVGEKVWIIRRVNGPSQTWLQIGRWMRGRNHARYGWIHESDVQVIR
jgi:hypothetical protein